MATCRYDEVYIRVTGRHADGAELGPLGKTAAQANNGLFQMMRSLTR